MPSMVSMDQRLRPESTGDAARCERTIDSWRCARPRSATMCSMPKTLLVAADVDRGLLERARGDGRFEVVHQPVRTEEDLAAIVGPAQILVTRAYNRVTRGVIDAAPRLELIAQGTSGIDNIDAGAARERGITMKPRRGD